MVSWLMLLVQQSSSSTVGDMVPLVSTMHAWRSCSPPHISPGTVERTSRHVRICIRTPTHVHTERGDGQMHFNPACGNLGWGSETESGPIRLFLCPIVACPLVQDSTIPDMRAPVTIQADIRQKVDWNGGKSCRVGFCCARLSSMIMATAGAECVLKSAGLNQCARFLWMVRLQDACFPRLNQAADHKPVSNAFARRTGAGAEVPATAWRRHFPRGRGGHAIYSDIRWCTKSFKSCLQVNGLEWSFDGDAMNVEELCELDEKTRRCEWDPLWPTH